MIGFVMEQIEGYLREELGGDDRAIELQYDGFPPVDAPTLFIGLYDDGESNIAGQTELIRREVLSVGVAIWARSNPTPADLLYENLRHTPYYHSANQTVDKYCRQVKEELAGTGRWDLWKRVRDAIKADCLNLGDVPIGPLYYVNATGPELYTPPQSEEGHFGTMQPEWIGRRLMFAGLVRIQSLQT